MKTETQGTESRILRFLRKSQTRCSGCGFRTEYSKLESGQCKLCRIGCKPPYRKVSL